MVQLLLQWLLQQLQWFAAAMPLVVIIDIMYDHCGCNWLKFAQPLPQNHTQNTHCGCDCK